MKFFGWLAVFISVILAACGGGGGSPGTVSGGGAPVALYTTAPESLTLSIGSAQQFSIGGGKPPYVAVSDNDAVVVVGVKDETLTLGGVVDGSAKAVIRDAAGAIVTVNVSVSKDVVRALFTTATPSVTLAPGTDGAQSYRVGGGTGPYTATSSNVGIATVSLTGDSMTVTGVRAGSTQIVVRDSVGETVFVNVTVGSAPLAVTPANATAIIDDVLRATIIGGRAPFRVSVGNTLVASAVVENGNELRVRLLQAGSTVVTVLDADNQSASYTLTSNAATPGIRLSPSVVAVSESDPQNILFTVYGAAPGDINVFSSDTTLLRASTSGSTVTVTTGSKNDRCVDADTVITITVVDSSRATGVATVTIKDSVGGCP